MQRQLESLFEDEVRDSTQVVGDRKLSCILSDDFNSTEQKQAKTWFHSADKTMLFFIQQLKGRDQRGRSPLISSYI